jgi:hypothetical protein
MIIDSDRILVGFTREQLKRIVLPALGQWKGPYKGKGEQIHTPTQKEDNERIMKEAAALGVEIAKFLGKQ